MQEPTIPLDTRKRQVVRRRAAGGALAALLLAATGACSSSSSSSSSSTASSSPSAAVLGSKDPAKGQPVNVGLISDGATAATDSSVELVLGQVITHYLNDYKGGLGGRPIKLFTCASHGDPASSVVCANQLVQDNVVAVVIDSLAAADAVWKPLHDAKIPEFTSSATSGNLLADTTGVFVLNDPLASLLDAPATLAKSKGLTKVTQVVIDVPTATAFMKTAAPAMFQRLGIHFAYVAVPPGTADMTPQMQKLASGNPGVVQIIGNDAFCTAALNGLRAVAFKGTISVISDCMSPATRKAVPGSYLNGLIMTATSPTGDSSNPDMKLFGAMVDTYAKGKVDTTDAGAESFYTSMMAMGTVLHAMTGPITPATVTAKVKAMPELPLPLGGGLTWRCSGKADPLFPAVCTKGTLQTTLDSSGLPTTYQPVASASIGN